MVTFSKLNVNGLHYAQVSNKSSPAVKKTSVTPPTSKGRKAKVDFSPSMHESAQYEFIEVIQPHSAG